MFLLTTTHTLAKLGQIREIKVSMKSGEHTEAVRAHNMTKACKLACMHAMCLHAQAHISAKLGQIRKMKVSMESGEHARHFWADYWFNRIIQWAFALYSCMHAPITGLNWVRSERLRYLRNQGNILDISEQTVLSKHTSIVWRALSPPPFSFELPLLEFCPFLK